MIAIIGPTASGKSELAIYLSEKFDGEIVSCDSMQIYKDLNIGTAKVSADDRRRIFHHMIDIIGCDREYSCADYVQEAKKAIEEIEKRNKLPVICGGTGLYFDSLVFNNNFAEFGTDEELRKKLESEDRDDLYERLEKIDPESAIKTHKNNKKRVIRALEIYYLTGRKKSEWDSESRKNTSPYDPLILGLRSENRDYLYERINKRCDRMIEDGLINEVRTHMGEMSRTSREAIGYKEIIDYLNGKCTLESATEKIKQASRNYAKRQMTWFKRYENVIWFDIDKYSKEEIALKAEKEVEKYLGMR